MVYIDLQLLHLPGMETGQHLGGLVVDLSPAWSDLSTLIVLPHLFRSGPLWLTAGKYIVQTMPSVYALQCLTGSLVSSGQTTLVVSSRVARPPCVGAEEKFPRSAT